MKNIELARFFDKDSSKIQTVTIADYESMVKSKDKDGLASFVYNRLASRYLLPHRYEGTEYAEQYKNGFSMMASYCLLIETIQSFKNGWGTTDGNVGNAFRQFFLDSPHFTELETLANEFYKNVRCGILHQGETTNGWRITRIGGRKLYTASTKTLDAIRFSERLEKELATYTNKLRKSEWDSSEWDNFRVKMRAIIRNCGPNQSELRKKK